MKILLTGCAGFIGMHVALQLLQRGDEIVGIDNLNDYYDVSLKEARLKQLTLYENFRFYKYDIANAELISDVFKHEQPQRVIHLAAQAGVRYSLINPHAYISANVQGFLHIIEGCRHHNIEHLVYASSSSVYGNNTVLPFSESQCVDHPVSLYAATKKTNELMAHTYSHLYQIPTTGLRFFTIYGPWGRPDMLPFKFVRAMLAGEPIDIYNNGQMVRDFTYIDDIVEGVVRVVDKIATPNESFDSHNPTPERSDTPYRIFNIGNNQPIFLMDYISALEKALGLTAIKNYLPMQPGDVIATAANTDALQQWINFTPNTLVPIGLQRFVEWYKAYYTS